MDFFTGQIMPIAFNYAPKQTALCAGQLIPVTQNQALFALLGISFGGTGGATGTFGLPNTTGRTIVGFGNRGSVMPIGSIGGEAQHTLTVNEMPQHVHSLNASTTGTTDTSPGGYLPGTGSVAVYGGASNLQPLGGAPMSPAGAGQPHANMQPSLPINFAIVLYGIFPSRS